MNNQKSLFVIEKIKALAMCLVGAMFIGYGITYFTPQSEYYVPRILIPLYNATGNVGLAIGIILLGIGLIGYAFTIWKKAMGATNPFIIVVVCLLLGAIVISRLYSRPIHTDTLREKIKSNEQLQKFKPVTATPDEQ